MKYPFSPEILDAMPEELAELFRALEEQLLEEICSRLKIAGELNEVTVEAIKALRSHGIDLEEIEKAIAEATGIAREKLDKLLDDVVERNQQYYSELIDKAKVTQPEVLLDAEFIANIRAQTQDELTNITRSMGFLLNRGGKPVMMEPAKAYQWALDSAVVQINSGAISYNEAIKRAVTQLADSGVKTVNYESGHVDHVDVAVRRAVMTGVSQLSDKYTVNSAKFLDTDLYEVSAHGGARDTGTGPANHKSWQGKVYSEKSGGKYPSIYDVCGLGTGEGLEGWNCRHRRFVFVDGVSERTYTDEQLANIDPPPFEFEGKTYTAYEATQKQREIERTIRKLKRREEAYKAAGLTEDARNMAARRRRLSKEYTDFSKAAGLPEQRERMKVRFVDDKSIQEAAAKKKKRVAKEWKPPTESAIIQEKAGGGSSVQTVGRIDIEKYRCVTNDIVTDEVIITEERIQHIKDRHPSDFERFVSYIPEILKGPDYIVEANRENTAVLLKEVEENTEKFKLILRLKVQNDPTEYKNSIISFWKVGETTWRKTLKNKNILYKSE